MARGLVRMESDSGFCIWWEATWKGDGRWQETGGGLDPKSRAQCSPSLKLHPLGLWVYPGGPQPPPVQAPHLPAAGRLGVAGGAAPAAGGSPQRAARSPSSARVKVAGGGLGLSTLTMSPLPHLPQHPTTVGNRASFSKDLRVS